MRTVNKRRISAFVLMSFLSVSAAAMMNMGAKDMELYGGERGKVPFPHHKHQIVLEDCDICHSLFPQKAGGIAELIQKGDLKIKQVMNDHCKKCHREKKKAGEKTGPITCSKCHIK